MQNSLTVGSGQRLGGDGVEAWFGCGELALLHHQLKLLLWHCKKAAQLSCIALTTGRRNGSKRASTVQSKLGGCTFVSAAVRNTSEGGVGVPGTAWTGSLCCCLYGAFLSPHPTESDQPNTQAPPLTAESEHRLNTLEFS